MVVGQIWPAGLEFDTYAVKDVKMGAQEHFGLQTKMWNFTYKTSMMSVLSFQMLIEFCERIDDVRRWWNYPAVWNVLQASDSNDCKKINPNRVNHFDHQSKLWKFDIFLSNSLHVACNLKISELIGIYIHARSTRNIIYHNQHHMYGYLLLC